MDIFRKSFFRIHRIAQRYYNSKMEEGLTAQEAHALRIISFRKTTTQQLLADRLGVDKSQVTRLVKKLEQEGYLTRTVNPEDRREKLISATPKADAVREQDLALTGRFYEWLLSEMNEEEREALAKTLEGLLERAIEARRNGFSELEEDQ
ncbi:MAG: MarR family transcriptional regulator [Clostridia bacterium]|nr:MarR family transcriptional regulator [Clostridia bacterium]